MLLTGADGLHEMLRGWLETHSELPSKLLGQHRSTQHFGRAMDIIGTSLWSGGAELLLRGCRPVWAPPDAVMCFLYLQ